MKEYAAKRFSFKWVGRAPFRKRVKFQDYYFYSDFARKLGPRRAIYSYSTPFHKFIPGCERQRPMAGHKVFIQRQILAVDSSRETDAKSTYKAKRIIGKPLRIFSSIAFPPTLPPIFFFAAKLTVELQNSLRNTTHASRVTRGCEGPGRTPRTPGLRAHPAPMGLHVHEQVCVKSVLLIAREGVGWFDTCSSGHTHLNITNLNIKHPPCPQD